MTSIRSAQQLDPVGFDQRIDDEGRTCLPLTPAAVTTMDEHRECVHAVAHAATGTPALDSLGFIDFHVAQRPFSD